jgi:hypothetical protein
MFVTRFMVGSYLILPQVGPKPNSTNVNNTHIQDFLFENFMGDIKEYVTHTMSQSSAAPLMLYVVVHMSRDRASVTLAGESNSWAHREGNKLPTSPRYFVANATGKEVAIFDLYPGTGTSLFHPRGYFSPLISQHQTSEPRKFSLGLKPVLALMSCATPRQ